MRDTDGSTKRPLIAFYIPQNMRPAGGLPSTIETYGPWMMTLEDRGSLGRYAWTLQTYLHLKNTKFCCELVDALPCDGIVLTHRDYLPDGLRPGPKLLIVCLLADREAPEWWGTGRHPYAQLHVVQSLGDPLLTRPSALWEAHFLPHWPQPCLIPRDATRGDRFENVAYMGIEMAPELAVPAWSTRLKALGLNWRAVPWERWHDYTEIDAVVAARSFDGRDYPYKPASKLYNAWHAGVPAVLGGEASYRAERRSDLDYLEAASVEEALLAVQRLRDDVELRRAMVENGRRRAQETEPHQLVGRWRSFLEGPALDAYCRWCATSRGARQTFLARRLMAAYRPDALMRRGLFLSHQCAQVVSAARRFAGGTRRSLRNWGQNRFPRLKV